MSCCCATFTLPSVYAGDTWRGGVGQLSSTGTIFSSHLALVRMVFTAAGSSTPALTLSSADSSQITIDDAVSWIFTLKKRTPIGIAAGFYSWTIETTDDNGDVGTYYKGTIQVTEDP